jgi:hypothetical protein
VSTKRSLHKIHLILSFTHIDTKIDGFMETIFDMGGIDTHLTVKVLRPIRRYC